MSHSYSSVTKSDNAFTAVSDVTPSGTVEEKLTWAYIDPSFDTWLELLLKEHWADWYFGTIFTDNWDSLIAPDRTYTNITTPDKTYTDVSDITPDGVIEEKFIWTYIDDEFDTWLELLAKEHWCDWYFGVAWSDNWASLSKSDNIHNSITTPSASYNEIIKSDNVFTNVSLIEGRNFSKWNYWYGINLLTWNNMHSTGKTMWNDWVYEYEYNKITTPSKTYDTVTVPSANYNEVTR